MELLRQRLLSLDIGMADYPNKAPSVKFHDGSRPRAFNPNLYNNVCLVYWVPEWSGGKPTSRHCCKVLVSIQA
jgi:ubiquitin-protein ligase